MSHRFSSKMRRNLFVCAEMTQNCVPIRVTRLKNCVYIVAPIHTECVVLIQRKHIWKSCVSGSFTGIWCLQGMVTGIGIRGWKSILQLAGTNLNQRFVCVFMTEPQKFHKDQMQVCPDHFLPVDPAGNRLETEISTASW